MMLRQHKLLCLMLLVSTLLSACGQVAAPPVELPAPIVGRITVATPPALGAPEDGAKIPITGAPGAVPAGVTVMAVNESIAGPQALLLNLLIRSAHAQSEGLPAICGEQGYGCAIAAFDGSFSLEIVASVGDSIVIGIIDPETGDFVSSLIRLTVPHPTIPQ